ncbi:unnamed protein product [Arctogadus glacialis]
MSESSIRELYWRTKLETSTGELYWRTLLENSTGELYWRVSPRSKHPDCHNFTDFCWPTSTAEEKEEVGIQKFSPFGHQNQRGLAG